MIWKCARTLRSRGRHGNTTQCSLTLSRYKKHSGLVRLSPYTCSSNLLMVGGEASAPRPEGPRRASQGWSGGRSQAHLSPRQAFARTGLRLTWRTREVRGAIFGEGQKTRGWARKIFCGVLGAPIAGWRCVRNGRK